MPNKPELLSPAGDPERLQMAVRYGADAVYLAGKSYGMRRSCKPSVSSFLRGKGTSRSGRGYIWHPD